MLWVEEADGAPLLHDFEQLADAVLPFTRDEAATIEAEKPPGRVIPFEGGEAEQQARRFSFETLHWDRGDRHAEPAEAARDDCRGRAGDVRVPDAERTGAVGPGERAQLPV